jgi:hypothetical protein
MEPRELNKDAVADRQIARKSTDRPVRFTG